MYYCYNIKKGLFDDEMKYAKDLGSYLFYDKEKDLFLDKDDNIVDIKGKKIFPRTGAIQSPKLLEALMRHEADSILNIDDYQRTLNWPKYIKTERRNIIMNGQQIIENPEKIVELFGKDKIFFKTKNKNYSDIIDVYKFLDKNSSFYKTLYEHQLDDFIISDVVNIIEDKIGKLEYRAFIIEGEIYNISRIHDYLLESIPKIVLKKLKDTINYLKDTNFPKSYVIDLFVTKDKNEKIIVDILECNPIIGSGTYLYNSIFSKSTDLLHECPSASIPIEKIKYGPVTEYGYDIKNKSIPSICYNLPGGFAADLASFSLLGTKSSKNQYFHFSSENQFNLTNINNSSLKPITSDLDLSDLKPLDSDDKVKIKEVKID